MQSNYCRDITIPVSPLKDYTILNQTYSNPEIWYADPVQVSDDFKEWLDQQGLVMTYPPLIFYTPKGGQCGIHIDGFGVTNRACVNFIIQGAGSLMHWYTLNENTKLTDQDVTQANTPYTLYQPEQVTHIHSQYVKWPSIVQTGIPHNVTNHTKEPRWCISCDISFKNNPEAGLSWEQAMEVFNKWM